MRGFLGLGIKLVPSDGRKYSMDESGASPPQ